MSRNSSLAAGPRLGHSPGSGRMVSIFSQSACSSSMRRFHGTPVTNAAFSGFHLSTSGLRWTDL
eukprot:4730029-Lingulodinium_polyedra.AAC.1